MIRALRRYVIRERFKKLVKSFDDQIEAARAKHLPVKPIQQAKADFVRQCLEGRR
jgi:hypothetical protein